MSHCLYFTNVFGAIDLVKDHLLDDAQNEGFENHLRTGFTAPGDYAYARELRNAIVHRGLDPVGHGVQPGQGSEGKYVFAMSPPYVFLRRSQKACVCTRPWLVDLAAACNQASNAAILGVVEREGLLDPAAYILDVPDTAATVKDPDVFPADSAEFQIEDTGWVDPEVAMEWARSRVRQLHILLGNMPAAERP